MTRYCQSCLIAYEEQACHTVNRTFCLVCGKQLEVVPMKDRNGDLEEYRYVVVSRGEIKRG